jgi:GT2 family glycosyltransferase
MSRILIQCVIVLYNHGKDCAALRSLAEICMQNARVAEGIAIFVHDNSPSSQTTLSDLLTIFREVEYHHAPDNPGLAVAYNVALKKAKSRGIDWLLLLDQDTMLNLSFLQELLAAVAAAATDQICAFLPKLIQEDRVLSPQFVGGLRNHSVPLEFSGVSTEAVTGLNSAASLRVLAVAKIGGFPCEYWLDYLDHTVFHRLRSSGGRVYVLRAQLEHRLSLLNLESEMSVDRYANVLNAEWMFVRETGAGGGTLLHRLRLLKRSLKRFLTVKDKSYALITLRAALMKAPTELAGGTSGTDSPSQ